MLRQPVAPMLARTAAEFPSGPRWAYEPKFDGWRCIAFFTGGRVRLQSRQQRPLTPYFPEITAAVAAQLPDGTVVDGELVAWRHGRLDFTALHTRLHFPRRAASACSSSTCSPTAATTSATCPTRPGATVSRP